MKELFGMIAAILAIIGLIPYIRNTLLGKTKPHLFTWIIWSICTVVIFFGQWVSGGGPGSWTTGITGLLSIVVMLLAIKLGTKNIKLIDKILFICALISIIPWVLTKDPTISVILITFIDVCAFIPTIRKSISEPQTETLFTYSLNILRHSLSVLALTTYSITTALFPITLVIMNIILSFVIILFRFKK